MAWEEEESRFQPPAHRDPTDAEWYTKDVLAAIEFLDNIEEANWEKAFDALLSIFTKISMDTIEVLHPDCACEDLVGYGRFGMSETCMSCMALGLFYERFGNADPNPSYCTEDGYPDKSMHIAQFTIAEHNHKTWEEIKEYKAKHEPTLHPQWTENRLYPFDPIKWVEKIEKKRAAGELSSHEESYLREVSNIWVVDKWEAYLSGEEE